MRDYDANVAIVLDTLAKYGFPESERMMHENLYEKLRPVLEVGENPVFTAEAARAWLEDSDFSRRANAVLGIERLDDVYRHGHILGSHLQFPFFPTEYYSAMVESYVSTLAETREKNVVRCIRYDCLHFCCFAQYNDVQRLEDVGYPLLEQYVSFLEERISGHYLHTKEGRISAFLLYWSRKGSCRIGHSLFLSYAKTGRVITMAALSEQARQVMEVRREESLLFPPDEFYALIPDFVQRMKEAGYSDSKTTGALCFLNCFYLFIDIENLGYDRTLVDAWVKDVAPTFFGTVSGLKHARRLFEMFEDYVTEGDLMPGHYWNHTATGYDILPDWYREKLDEFIEDKKKEGRAAGTLRVYKDTGARFYRFLESKGVDSFEKITPEVIKQFNLEDVHRTSVGKTGILSRLRNFLVHLEIRHVVQEGLHNAIPTCPTGGDKRIVKVCTDEERQKLRDFCETPSTPRQIRDAALLRIGMTTGMRPSDVVKLRWEDVDFQKGCARFNQSKTGVPHMVSLDVATRNALFVYLRDVRPKNLPHSYLFVSLLPPHNPLSSGAGGKAMAQAGVHEGGYRKLRKTHATDLIAGGATIKEVAQDLGHSNTNNVHKYVVLDEKRMRLCPLSMEETGLTLDRRRYTDG